MKILYAIQGTGNGHISVAMELIPLLKNRVDVDILISGNQVELELPFDIKYEKKVLVLFLEKTEALILSRLLKH